MRFLDQFSVVLLDMNGTFMFGHDRFGPEEDYFATYESIGGTRLTRDELMSVWLPSLAAILEIYETPARYDDFPALSEVFREYGAGKDDLPDLERLFALHEIGDVPPMHAKFIAAMAKTHSLGVVSNICAHPSTWLHTCASAGVFAAFKVLVFSSKGRSIKPSLVLFRRAMAAFPPESRILFVGDSLERDIIPARALGMSTTWIAPRGSSHPAADRVVTSLPELAHVGT
jgi:FMN phosphatase YigB (HAD superfamily)